MHDTEKKRKIIVWLIVFITISPVFLVAQFQRYSFHHLTPDEGLSQGSNDHLYHDSKGFVWLSSLDGLNRFDGKNVKIYKSIAGDSTSLLSNIVTSNFFEDASSNLWFSTYEGIHCYNRAQDNFQRFQLKDENGKHLKQDYHVFHLDRSTGDLWLRIGIGTTGRLYRFTIHGFQSEILCPLNGQRNYPVLDAHGKLKQIVSCLFNMKKGIEILDIQIPFKRQVLFNKATSNTAILAVRHIYIAAEDEWYLSTSNGFMRFQPISKKQQFFNTYKGFSIGNTFSSVDLNDSTLLVATRLQSILLFDRNTLQFTASIPYESEKKLGLHLPVVNRLYKDRKENIWMTSTSSGVNYANINKRKFDLPNAFIDQYIIAIFESKDHALFCSYTTNHIAYFPNREADLVPVQIHFPRNKPAQKIKYFFEDETGVLWAVTVNYLLKWNADELQFDYTQDLPSSILSFYKSKTGKLLFSTYSGLYEWKGRIDKIEFMPFQEVGPYQKELATALYEDAKGHLYLALDASRLLILKKEANQYIEIKNLESIGYAKSFHEVGDTLWVATTTGILAVNTSTLSSRLLNEKTDGAPNETYYSILADEQGAFWLSSNKGIICYNPKEKKHCRYTLTDGLQGNEYNTDAFLKTSQGEIWMGGTKGLNRFFPENIQALPLLPQVELTALQVNDNVRYKDKEKDKQIGELASVHLDYKENTLSFYFVALEYSDPKNNQFQYQLENHEDTWVNAGKNGFARYSNLGSGDYVFKVKAANSDGIWNETARRLNIHIRTPWWKTSWFYLACTLLIASIIYGVFTYRLQQALKIERMRVKISSDLHDDVGSLLSGLAMQSELLELTALPERKPKLQRISELSRSAMSRMRDTVWAIDARKDKLENLLDRIREHAAETLATKNIAFDLQVEALALDKNMPSHIRQNIYLICKEAITNTTKHSNGDKMQMNFAKFGHSGIHLSIHDNGKFVEKTHKTTGLGMSNMEMRAEQIGASLEIDQTNGFLINVKVK